MWFSFWRSRDRFSIDELQYLVDQLQKVQIINEINKDFVIEALRSIAEIMTYGDQHDPSFFEFFMEKQIMGEFVRILKISRVTNVAVQLLQTMSIMIQNLKSERAIYYIFGNEHINTLITYSFDFRNEELLSYYISFLRAISGKLNKTTVSLLVKTSNDEVISFPLYTEAIRFAFHEENMVRIAIRALSLNIFHVGDENVNTYVSGIPLSDYFSKLVAYFRKQCINLDKRVSDAARNPDSSDSVSSVLTAIDEIEDNLYYYSDIISSGVPELGRLITDNILQLLIFPLLLPSLKEQQEDGPQISAATSLYILCCILHIAKTKDLACSIATAFFCVPKHFLSKSGANLNGFTSNHCHTEDHEQNDPDLFGTISCKRTVSHLKSPSSSKVLSPRCSSSLSNCDSEMSLREVLLLYIINGHDTEVLGSLSLFATLLQTKELDESMLDGLGILPQRKQHKKLLLQALVGESSGEEQLFSSEKGSMKDSSNTECERFLQKFKAQYGLLFCCGEFGVSSQVHRYQVLDALFNLFCRSNVSAEVLWAGSWLLRQLLPHSEPQLDNDHLELLKESYNYSVTILFEETKGSWCDMLINVLVDEWKNCKKAIESSSPAKDPKRILLTSQSFSSEGDSSFAAGEKMCNTLKVFVLRHQLLMFCTRGYLSDIRPLGAPSSSSSSRAKVADLDALVPKPGTEINLADAVPCRIAFKRGRERHFCFLAISKGTSGWILLAEELPLRQQFGIVHVAAPLGGSNPKIDDKHPKWLHLRIRPSSLPSLDPFKFENMGKGKGKVLVDGRWTLAFSDEQMCKSAESMVVEEMHLQSTEVEKRLKFLLNID